MWLRRRFGVTFVRESERKCEENAEESFREIGKHQSVTAQSYFKMLQSELTDCNARISIVFFRQ
jgi:hypothetical protein